jgi:hypothetical protein
MPDIATLPEFASFLQVDVDTATANLVLLDLAQGQIIDEIGARNPWPATAKAVALSAAKRAYVNPEGASSETVGGTSVSYTDGNMGVFLTEDERTRLHRIGDGGLAFSISPTYEAPPWYTPLPVADRRWWCGDWDCV